MNFSSIPMVSVRGRSGKFCPLYTGGKECGEKYPKDEYRAGMRAAATRHDSYTQHIRYERFWGGIFAVSWQILFFTKDCEAGRRFFSNIMK